MHAKSSIQQTENKFSYSFAMILIFILLCTTNSHTYTHHTDVYTNFHHTFDLFFIQNKKISAFQLAKQVH